MSFPTPSDSSKKSVRDRSLPHARPFFICGMLFFCWLLALTATVTAFYLAVSLRSPHATNVVIGGLSLCGVLWFITFFKRRSILCPLCKGTPLLNSGALTHARAVRIFPFNHGITALISIMFSQRFHCMYCGSSFDLFKKNKNLHIPEMEKTMQGKAKRTKRFR